MKKTISNRKIKHDINNIIFIPARTGSTRVPNKNIQKIGEETLLSRKIKNCLKAKIGEVIVSTNSAKIKKYSEKLGAKCLFLRPKIYSTSKGFYYINNSSLLKVFKKIIKHTRLYYTLSCYKSFS